MTMSTQSGKDVSYMIADSATGHFFQASGDGTAPLQLKFEMEAEQFVFLRKGEWGVGELVTPVLAWMSAGGADAVTQVMTNSADVAIQVLEWAKEEDWATPLAKITAATLMVEQIIASIERSVRRIKGMIDDVSSQFKAEKTSLSELQSPDRKVIRCAGEKSSDLALPSCVLADIHVRQYQEDDGKYISRHRYYVNEKHFCLFLGLGERRYVGWYGDDQRMIEALRADFLRDWDGLGEASEVTS